MLGWRWAVCVWSDRDPVVLVPTGQSKSGSVDAPWGASLATDVGIPFSRAHGTCCCNVVTRTSRFSVPTVTTPVTHEVEREWQPLSLVLDDLVTDLFNRDSCPSNPFPPADPTQPTTLLRRMRCFPFLRKRKLSQSKAEPSHVWSCNTAQHS